MNERIPNKPLSGEEVKKMVVRDVDKILSRDGMFSTNIAFGRLSYEVRVTLHMDNPIYPEHVSVIGSKPVSDNELEIDPALKTIETAPLSNTSDNEIVFSEEVVKTIMSPNHARIEANMPITYQKRNLDTNQIETKEIKYEGNIPEGSEVGNITETRSTIDDQRNKWNKSRKGGK